MADIVNLRRARKAKARQTGEIEADANRLKFGRSKAEKTAQTTQARQATKHLDQRRLDKDKSKGRE